MTLPEIITMHALHGLVYAMLLFLVSSGLTLVFGMMNVLSIAHAAFYMLGAYFSVSVVSFWAGFFLAPLGVGIIGYLVERFLLRKIHVFGHAYELLLTFGVFFVVGELVKLIWGDFPLASPKPTGLNGITVLMDMQFPIYRFFIIFVGLCVMGGLILFLFKTRIGITIRSIVSDAEMVKMLGINTDKVFLFVFAASSALAGLGGVVAAPFLVINPGMHLDMMIDMFIVVVVGGFGSIFGALIASIMLAELQSFGVLLIPKAALVFQFMLMAGVLIVKPTGLFGEKS